MRLHHSIRTGITAAAALAAIAGTGACLPAVASAAAAPVRLAPALDGAAKGGAVIVVMKDQNAGLSMRAQGTMLRAADRASQASVVSSIRASHGTGLVRLTAPDSVAATLSAAGISRLRSNPAVARIIPDPKVRVAQAVPAPGPAVRQVAASHTWSDSQGCPFNPDPSRPLQEPEADTDIRASDGSPGAPGMGNSIATGAGVVVANEGMDELAGNPNFTRADGSHVVLDAPDYTADDSNDEFYGDASSIAAQGTVDYQYSGALPNAGIPADCTFYIKGDAPGASLLDLSDTPYDPPVQTLAQVVSGIDQAVSENADVISESFGATYIPGSPFSQYFEAADNAAVAAGVTVVASSGDSGDSGTVMAPSADPLVISAGAVDNFRLVAMDDGYRRYVSENMAALSSGGTAPSGKTVDL
ncbi:MAG TPA: S8 family serine peptidase, partial [Streptosporangiaceae bacterium]